MVAITTMLAMMAVTGLTQSQARESAETNLRQRVNDVIRSVCGGRCELLSASVEVAQGTREVLDPGFDTEVVDEGYVPVRAHVKLLVDETVEPKIREGIVQAVRAAASGAAPDVVDA